VFRRIEPILMAALVLAAACGGAASPVAQATASPTPAPTATPTPVTTSVIASGRLDSIPAGTLFVNYMDLPQVSAGSIKHAHIAGFVYTVKGTHEMDIDGSAPLMIQAGSAAFIGATVMHSHINPGATANDWLFIGLRPASSRPLATIVPGQKELYTTADLTQITPGAYMETLSDSRVIANGVDRQSGPSLRVIFVIDGTLAVSGDAGMTGTVSAGQGAYSLPGASLVLTAGAAGAHYLIFSLTPMN
jgi:quercetin dioxygenase-like cupin family protein